MCLFLILGCAKKEESVKTPAPDQTTAQVPVQAPAQEQKTVTAPKEAAQQSQLDKAILFHKDFVKAFSETLGKKDTTDGLRSRIDLVDKTRISCMMLSSDIHDPAATDFLTRFSDLLQKYLDLANKHLATLEEEARLYASAKESEAALSKVPEKEKAEATAKLNLLITKHNELVQGPLKKESNDLNSLVNELLKLK
jgi:hypothetical protein